MAESTVGDGETWLLTGGPHRHSGIRAALDFAVNGGRVRAAREGVAYTPCGQRSDHVRIDHGGFSTNYYHLSGIAVANGSAVARYNYIAMIGNTANCLGGASFGAHVHFWITRGTTPVPINGIDLGGWTVSELPGDYNGCMTRIRDGYRQCTRYDSSGRVIEGYGRIQRGALGSGNIPPNPPIPLSPANNETVRTASVPLCVDNGGDPDNGPHTPELLFPHYQSRQFVEH